VKALLDTNIIIHREASRIINRDIGILFKWLDKANYIKCVHPFTIGEIQKHSDSQIVDTFNVKMKSYEVLNTIAPKDKRVISTSEKHDKTENDRIDTALLNEVYSNRVDILISEDNKIHFKAELLGIPDKVFTIDSFLEKIVSENPSLINYKVLSIRTEYFGNIDINDSFFDSLRENYIGFNDWFSKKSNEQAYVSFNKDKLLAFLYLKKEGKEENYSDISPIFKPKKRLKIGTLKVSLNGVRMGERFMRIIFDNALLYKVDEIYVTIFDIGFETKLLINLLKNWGFHYHGNKGEESVYVRNFTPFFDVDNPKLTYPYLSANKNFFIVPIYPEYHKELFPDSYLKTESLDDFINDEPHRNAISKVFVSRAFPRTMSKGDVLIFYRTAPKGEYAKYKSVITTIGLVENVIDGIKDEKEFILKCRKRSIFTDAQLKDFWDYNPRYRPFIIKLLYMYSFSLGNRLNREKLLNLGIISGSENELRGFKQITKDQFLTIIKETQTHESIIVY